MQSNTLILIVGTNGVGKSTLMRAVIRGLGGQHESSDKFITTVNNNKDICIIGPYGASKCCVGGDSFCATSGRDILTTIQEAKKSYRIVLCEGRYIATFSNSRINAYFSGGTKVIAIHLSGDENYIKKNIEARGGKFSAHMVKGVRSISNWLKKIGTIGALTLEIPPSVDYRIKQKLILNIIENELRK